MTVRRCTAPSVRVAASSSPRVRVVVRSHARARAASGKMFLLSSKPDIKKYLSSESESHAKTETDLLVRSGLDNTRGKHTSHHTHTTHGAASAAGAQDIPGAEDQLAPAELARAHRGRGRGVELTPLKSRASASDRAGVHATERPPLLGRLKRPPQATFAMMIL